VAGNAALADQVIRSAAKKQKDEKTFDSAAQRTRFVHLYIWKGDPLPFHRKHETGKIEPLVTSVTGSVTPYIMKTDGRDAAGPINQSMDPLIQSLRPCQASDTLCRGMRGENRSTFMKNRNDMKNETQLTFLALSESSNPPTGPQKTFSKSFRVCAAAHKVCAPIRGEGRNTFVKNENDMKNQLAAPKSHECGAQLSLFRPVQPDPVQGSRLKVQVRRLATPARVGHSGTEAVAAPSASHGSSPYLLAASPASRRCHSTCFPPGIEGCYSSNRFCGPI
jgi:hypothetical protein